MPNQQASKKALFLDRDGVINKKMPVHDYVKSWQEFEFLPEIEKLIKKFNRQGYLVVVVTNQKGIARGLVSEKTVKEIHQRMIRELRKKGAIIDAVYFCPHDDKDNCDCRKPKPGMLFQAAKDLNIDLSQSILIGDEETDLKAAKAAGCQGFLITKLKKSTFK